jgi:hypothetical protein
MKLGFSNPLVYKKWGYFMGLGMRKRTMISLIEIEIVKGMSLGPNCGGRDVICEDVEVGLVNLMRRGLEGGRV